MSLLLTNITVGTPLVKPQVLLDFDGVLLRSKKASNMVAKRCASFVGSKMNIASIDKSTNVNRYLYTNFGHTLLGLKALGYECSLQEFNDYVYGDIDYNELCEDIIRHEAFDNLGLQNLLDQSENVYIFSNAPHSWIYNIMKSCCPNTLMKNTKYIDTHNCLKTSRYLYHEICTRLSRNDSDKLFFIDDSLKNLEIVLHDDRFNCILFDEDMNVKTKCITIIDSLEHYTLQ